MSNFSITQQLRSIYCANNAKCDFYKWKQCKVKSVYNSRLWASVIPSLFACFTLDCHTDLRQLFSSLECVLQVAPPIVVRLQLAAEQVTQRDATQAEPLLHPLTLQSLTWAWTTWDRNTETQAEIRPYRHGGVITQTNLLWEEDDEEEIERWQKNIKEGDDRKWTMSVCVCVSERRYS